MKKSLIAGAIACAFGPAAAQEVSTFDLGTVVVTPQRFESSAIGYPASISVVTQEDIKRSPVTTLPELLSTLPGIRLRNNSGSPDAQIDARGFGITGNQNVLVLLDGQRLNEIELVSPKWSAIPVDAIDRIEIIRGSGAVLYGPGATGGVVNIITKRPSPGTRQAFLAAGYGTLDTSDIRTGASWGSDMLSLGLFANQFHTDNYRDNNAVNQKNIAGDLRFDGLGGTWTLKFGADDQTLRLPGPRTETQLETDRRGTSTPNDYSTRKGGQLMLSSLHRAGDVEFTADVAYREREATALFANWAFLLQTKTDVVAISPRVKLPYRVGAYAGEVVAGIDWDDWNYDSRNNFGGRTQAGQKDQAVYLQSQVFLGENTNIALGGRMHRVETTVRDYLSYKQETRTPRAFEMAMRHKFGSAVSGYAKLGRSFRIAVVDENWGQVSLLEPQTSSDREVGLDARLGALQLGVALYQMNLTNEIGFLPSPLIPPIGANVNLPPTRRQGMEVQGVWKVSSTFSLSANYTWAEAKFRSGIFNGVDVSGKSVPLVPKRSANLTARWDFAPRTSLAANAQYVGEQYFDNDQANSFGRKMPSYTLLNARLTRETGPWLLSATVKNLLNKKYFTYGIVNGSSFDVYPEPERTFFVSAEYRFK